MCVVPLSTICPGDKCVIDSVKLAGAIGRRLEDIGFLPGTVVKCAYFAPSGSPVAFWIKGALIALRRSDCQKILITRCA